MGSISTLRQLSMRLLRRRSSKFAPFLINPQKITHTVFQNKLEMHHGHLPKSGVLDGDWDNLAEPFKETLIFQGLRQRFLEGYAWHRTFYYKELSNGLFSRKIEKKGGIDKHLAYYDALFARIERDGYSNDRNLKPIKICGCSGQILARYDGNHRLSMALILGVEEVMVKYHLIHPLHRFDIRDAAVTKIRQHNLIPAVLISDPLMELPLSVLM